MKVFINSDAVELYRVRAASVIADPKHDFIFRNAFAHIGLWESDDRYRKLETVEVLPTDGAMEYSAPGFIYVQASPGELRRLPNENTLVLDLEQPSQHKHTLAAIYLRQLGYGLDTDLFDYLVPQMFLVAMPGMVPGELEAADYITGDFMKCITHGALDEEVHP